jgi:hypothetical protein
MCRAYANYDYFQRPRISFHYSTPRPRCAKGNDKENSLISLFPAPQGDRIIFYREVLLLRLEEERHPVD